MHSFKIIFVLATILFATPTFAQLPSYVPTDGLVAFYPFSGNADDEGPEELDGDVFGSVLGPDRNMVDDAAFYFANTYIICPSDADLNSGEELTISVWVNLFFPDLDQKIIGKTNDSFNSGFVLGVQNSEIYPEVWDDNGTNHTLNAGFIETDSTMWDHIAITWKSGEYLVAYQNGTAVDSISASSAEIGANDELMIVGVSPWSLNPTFLAVFGAIDDIGIWDRALSAAEIQQLYLATPLSTSDLSEQKLLGVFPNPTTDLLTISANSELAGETFEIQDQLGRTLLDGKISQKNQNLDISYLPAGIYFLKMTFPPGDPIKILKL